MFGRNVYGISSKFCRGGWESIKVSAQQTPLLEGSLELARHVTWRILHGVCTPLELGPHVKFNRKAPTEDASQLEPAHERLDISLYNGDCIAVSSELS